MTKKSKRVHAKKVKRVHVKKVKRVHAKAHAKAMTPVEIDLVGMALARLLRTKAARQRFDLDGIMKMQSVVGDLIAFASDERERKRSAKVSAAKRSNGTGKNGPVRIKRPAFLDHWECLELDCGIGTGKANRLYCAKHRGYGS